MASSGISPAAPCPYVGAPELDTAQGGGPQPMQGFGHPFKTGEEKKQRSHFTANEAELFPILKITGFVGEAVSSSQVRSGTEIPGKSHLLQLIPTSFTPINPHQAPCCSSVCVQQTLMWLAFLHPALAALKKVVGAGVCLSSQVWKRHCQLHMVS